MNGPHMPDGLACTYCGGIATVWDHVIPASLLRPMQRHRYDKKDWLTECCEECNAALSDRMLLNIPTRADWLYWYYRKKYQKLMIAPRWTDTEIEGLKGNFKTLVIDNMLAQSELDHKLSFLRKVASRNADYLRPKEYNE